MHFEVILVHFFYILNWFSFFRKIFWYELYKCYRCGTIHILIQLLNPDDNNDMNKSVFTYWISKSNFHHFYFKDTQNPDSSCWIQSNVQIEAYIPEKLSTVSHIKADAQIVLIACHTEIPRCPAINDHYVQQLYPQWQEFSFNYFDYTAIFAQ